MRCSCSSNLSTTTSTAAKECTASKILQTAVLFSDLHWREESVKSWHGSEKKGGSSQYENIYIPDLVLWCRLGFYRET